MNTPVADLFDVVVTPWKLVGYLGVLLFAGRWLVQMAATRKHGRPVFPGLFWTMSVLGSVLLLSYFIWAKTIRSVCCRTCARISRASSTPLRD